MEYINPPLRIPPPPQNAQRHGAPLQPPPQTQQQTEQVRPIPTSNSLVAMLEYIAGGGVTVTTFFAIALIGASKQTKYELTIKFTQFSALKYFLAANIVVFVYSIASSLLMTILINSKPILIRLSIAISDLVFVSMLLIANGAASEVRRQLDDSSGGWQSSCDSFGRFCSQIKASIAMSMLAAGCYLGLIILSLVTFAFKRN